MSQGESRGYGLGGATHSKHHLMFDGDERRYEQWEVKLLAYLRLKKLKKQVLGLERNDPAKNEEAFAEIVQFLDDHSLSLVMRDASDNGRKAISILREHYQSTGKPRVISLYTTLTSLQKGRDSVTDYVIRAESVVNALRNAGQVIEESLIIALVMNGLPEFKSFVFVMT